MSSIELQNLKVAMRVYVGQAQGYATAYSHLGHLFANLVGIASDMVPMAGEQKGAVFNERQVMIFQGMREDIRRMYQDAGVTSETDLRLAVALQMAIYATTEMSGLHELVTQQMTLLQAPAAVN